jgi:hypothetical protein
MDFVFASERLVELMTHWLYSQLASAMLLQPNRVIIRPTFSLGNHINPHKAKRRLEFQSRFDGHF